MLFNIYVKRNSKYLNNFAFTEQFWTITRV